MLPIEYSDDVVFLFLPPHLWYPLPVPLPDNSIIQRVLERSSVTHPSLYLSWLERDTEEKNRYPQVPGSILAKIRDFKSVWS